MDIRPDYANLLANGRSERVDPEDVSVNDIIIVNPGERIPLDGVVVKGSSTLDTSALTGESLPRKATVGTKVFSGAINKNGSLEIKVSKTFYDSTASKILQLVEDASANKAETERFITKFSKYYTPIVVGIALTVAVIPPIFLGGFSDWLYRALIFLVISCPCALVVSVPLGFFGGIGNSSKKGVLVKGSNFLEALNKVESIIFDKTGTLTEGIFKVVAIKGINGSEEEIMELAAHAELNSIHPIAASIKSHYGMEIDRERISHYKELEGLGIKVMIDDDEILIGNHKLLEKKNISFKESSEFGTIVYLVKNNIHLGNIVIRDEIKAHSKNAIKDLKAQGKEVYMLTGDNKTVADIIAKELGIDNVYSNLLPHEKVGKFDEIKSKSKGLVAFVGDGINDAPVLAKADIGISMGGLGSDAAIEASDIVLMEDNPHKISTVINVAKRTRNIVMQNIVFALGIKILVMSLGVFGEATMWEAIFADVGVALLAVLNSTRTLR
jgi:Cd2+/Zn2+-exporting ATPase